jgi:hypothetical protein
LLDFREVASVGVVADEKGPLTLGVAAAIALLALITFAIFDDISGVTCGAKNGFKHHEQSVGIETLLVCRETQV